jgi:hypothetical protein
VAFTLNESTFSLRQGLSQGTLGHTKSIKVKKIKKKEIDNGRFAKVDENWIRYPCGNCIRESEHCLGQFGVEFLSLNITKTVNFYSLNKTYGWSSD